MGSHESVLEPKITFVVAMNNREVFENNFLASACLRGTHAHEVIVQERFMSAPKAYNEALDAKFKRPACLLSPGHIFPRRLAGGSEARRSIIWQSTTLIGVSWL